MENIMKKFSTLALATTFAIASTAAQAVTIYDKDGTNLGVNGRIQTVMYSCNNDPALHQVAGDHDSSLQNSARFGLNGLTDIGFAKVLGFAQWDMADGSKYGDHILSRDIFVGIDFGTYGKFIAGRYRPAVQAYVTLATDIMEDYSANTLSTKFERNSGHIDYQVKLGNLDILAGILTASDNYAIKHSYKGEAKYDVEGGFNLCTGYTFSNAIFDKDIVVKLGYEYLKGQNDYKNTLDDVKTVLGTVSLGNFFNGFYTAFGLNERLFDYNNGFERLFRKESDPEKLKTLGFEYVVAYTTDNGISVRTGIEQMQYKTRDISVKVKALPVYVEYKAAPNVQFWTEARFDLTDTKEHKKASDTFNTIYTADRNCYTLGARYTF